MHPKEVIVVIDQQYVTAQFHGKDNQGHIILDGTPIKQKNIEVLLNLRYTPGRQQILPIETAYDGGSKPTLLLTSFYKKHHPSDLPWE